MENKIKRVYIGLPHSLIEKILWVGRNYRTNQLSHQPGGTDIVVEYFDDSVLGYDWIKYPSRYIHKIFIGEGDDSSSFTKSSQLENIRLKVNRIYARKYKDEAEFLNVPFQEIWNSVNSEELPWEPLIIYDEDYIKYPNESHIGQNILGKVSISKFKEVTKLEKLQFTMNNGISIGVCPTPVGNVFLSKDVDYNKPLQIIIVETGVLWLVNY